MERFLVPVLYTILDLSDPKIKGCYASRGVERLSNLGMVSSIDDAQLPGDKRITVLELDKAGRPFPGARSIQFDSSSVVHEFARVVRL